MRENATLDELLKKAENFVVSSGGEVYHQGQKIEKVKLNGKEYAGGTVSQAVRNLPADIIEKFQVVDDYGEQAARTGIKTEKSKKILNVTTRADRSIGNTARMTAQAGNNERYHNQLFVQRINANQELGVIGTLSNTVNGIAKDAQAKGGEPELSGGAPSGSSPGTTRLGSPVIHYRDQWSKKVQVLSSYGYDYSDNLSKNNSYGERYTSIGIGEFVDQNDARRKGKAHVANIEVDIALDSLNYLQIKPSYGFDWSQGSSFAFTDQINSYTTGFEHELSNGTTNQDYQNTRYGLAALYVHAFRKPRRNVSVQASITRENTRADGAFDKHYQFFADPTQDFLVRDSSVNLLANQGNQNVLYETTLTFTEPISQDSQLEWIGNIRWSENRSNSTQDTVLSDGQLKRLHHLDQRYNYSTTQERLTFNYRYTGVKLTVSMGVTAIPFSLKGHKLDNSTGWLAPTSRSDFRMIPAFHFVYAASTIQRFQVNYSGANQEPNFQQLQPFTDRSDSRNLIVGNPDLKPEFTHVIKANYDHYMPSRRFNLSLGLDAFAIENKVATNILQVLQPLVVDPDDPTQNKYSSINEIHYVNLSGSKGLIGRYSVTQQLDERRYNLSLIGELMYRRSPAMSNGLRYQNAHWRFTQRMASRMSPTDNIEINPFVEFGINKMSIASLHAPSTTLKTLRIVVDGKMHFLKTFQINYRVSKNYISGISEYNTNPFVFDAGFEKQFLPRRNLVMTLNIYDLFHQNNFINQMVTPHGVINTESNALSRYFLIGLRLNLQKWSGTPTRKGEAMKRRGDGSFIY